MNLHIQYVHWIAARLPNCEIWRFFLSPTLGSTCHTYYYLLYHKICYKFVHNVFSYRGHRQTHRQTNAGENIFPRFRGDNNAPCIIAMMHGDLVVTLSRCALLIYRLFGVNVT